MRELYGEPSAHSAMARTLSIPCGIAFQVVLDGGGTTRFTRSSSEREAIDAFKRVL
jgi:hypothetical protein